MVWSLLRIDLTLIDVEALIATDHPTRRIKALVDEVLRGMDAHFEEMYVEGGRPSISPERLLKAKILQALFKVRSDRQLCARLQTDRMFRWFIDLPLDQAVFDASTFSQNQERLLRHAVADLFFAEVVSLAKQHGCASPATRRCRTATGWRAVRSPQRDQRTRSRGGGRACRGTEESRFPAQVDRRRQGLPYRRLRRGRTPHSATTGTHWASGAVRLTR